MAYFGPDQRIYLAQLGMGLAITLLLFYISWQISGQAWFGGVLALAHSLNLGQLFFEANLLTETSTTFWIILSLAGLAFWLYHPKQRSAGVACGIGLATTAAALTRQLFIYLPFWILLFLLIEDRRGGSVHGRVQVYSSSRPARTSTSSFYTIKTALAFLLPVALLFGVCS